MLHLPICLACLVVAAAFIYVEHIKKFLAADIVKGLASVLFVVVGILSAGIAKDDSYARIIVIGLVIGAIADVLLNLRYVFEGELGQRVFLVGIIVFLIGHIVYIVGIAPRCPSLLAGIVLGIAVAAALLWWIFGKITAKPAFKAFGVVYIGAISILNCVAATTMLLAPTAHAAIFFLGALLFLVSDVVLILNTFGGEFRFSFRVTNLMLYYAGQLLIALSLQLV